MQKLPNHKILFIYGPTGVGKTAIAEKLGGQLPIEIVNMDVGQFYEPLTIGTAKPDWHSSPIPHHLFDTIHEPRNYTVVQYRHDLADVVWDIWQRQRLPVVVGGSGFYLRGLFFPPKENPIGAAEDLEVDRPANELWERLRAIDPERAQSIGKNDLYRIERALALWKTTGKKPSELQPTFDPLPGNHTIVCLNRDRHELYSRINDRVVAMMHDGWLEEVKRLRGSDWERFLKEKKLIGYNELLDCLNHAQTSSSLTEVIQTIQQRTRNYAKRQLTFWRMLSKQLEHERAEKDGALAITLAEVNLTTVDLDLYIKQLSHVLVNSHT
ncbi:MAG TPA: tRNA (adenosine(37)-N6)-dimethylallyltransferase MiaA [Candidatus Limnocylindria bacterium]|nr:tRNA (adenosine(37)-N6)-dimethylallyltransferase MiaA [Candidatus Limnocylindria bacterium]